MTETRNGRTWIYPPIEPHKCFPIGYGFRATTYRSYAISWTDLTRGMS